MKGLIYFLFLILVSPQPLRAQLPAGFIRERIATGLNPTSMVIAPDGRVFITEKNGTIRVVEEDHLLDEPLVSIEVDDSNERGLGHMALHPDFEQNGYFYVFYSVPAFKRNRISRFTANGDKTIPGSEKIIMELDELGSDVHNGGDMIFGFDGYLYVATGDGAQSWRGEDLGNTNAKVLRMDEEGNAAPENPFYTSNYLRAKFVYSYGFRNPFSIAQNPLTGEIYVNDVGASKAEEINRIERGAFFGWPKVEGKRTNEVVPAEYRDPIFSYKHVNGYCCIVGSSFYYPSIRQFPEYYLGKYFYSDYCKGHIRMLDTETGIDLGVFLSDGDRVVDIETADNGSMYYLERKGLGDGSPEDNEGTTNGTLWRISYTGTGFPFISVQPQAQLVSEGETATFHVQVTGAQPLQYDWYVNHDLLFSGNEPLLAFSNASIESDSTTIQVDVSNSLGHVLSEEVLLRVTNNHRPVPTILTPEENWEYQAGDEIAFSGLAMDPEDGLLSGEDLAWRIDFHHGTHTHPALSWQSGISYGSYVIPATGETSEDVWYRLYLKATDHSGLPELIYRDYFPKLGKVKIESKPAGLNVNLDGVPKHAPYEVEGVQGIKRYISVPIKQVFGDSIYFFKSWADGSTALIREIKTSQNDQLFKALFSKIASGKGTGLTAKYFANTECEGIPEATALDSIIDHGYYLNPPYAGLPEDYFSIQWDGYLRPYHSGNYTFVTYSDDGVRLDVNDIHLIDGWTDGSQRNTGTLYLEAGRLYPIRLQFYELVYGATISLGWSGDDFAEEIIPSAQLYPEHAISGANVFELDHQDLIAPGKLQLQLESYRDDLMKFVLTDMIGRTYALPDAWVMAGKNIITLDVAFLPPGLYLLSGLSVALNQPINIKFVKVN